MNAFNIKVVGLGDGGARAINKMLAAGVGKGLAIDFISVGSDENILLTGTTRKNIFLNRDMTTLYKNFTDNLRGANLIIIVGGLGGNAAKAAVPIITSCAKTLDAKIVAFMCRPFVVENAMRKSNAQYTLKNLLGKVDTIFTLTAEKFLLFRIKQPQVSVSELFEVAEDIFCQGVKIFLDILGEKNPTLTTWGNAAFGYGTGETSIEAIKSAAKFPTLAEDEIKNASKVFVRLSAGKNFKLGATESAKNFIREQLKSDAEFFSREDVDPSLGDKIFAAIILNRTEAAK